ncbi:hypothetical protein RP20_CCG003671 [Aedes albopictus]|nr:hypothetical protein RP20_CCG003671 [Aedes albopictus]
MRTSISQNLLPHEEIIPSSKETQEREESDRLVASSHWRNLFLYDTRTTKARPTVRTNDRAALRSIVLRLQTKPHRRTGLADLFHLVASVSRVLIGPLKEGKSGQQKIILQLGHFVNWRIDKAERLVAAEAQRPRPHLIEQQRAPQKGLFFSCSFIRSTSTEDEQGREGRGAVNQYSVRLITDCELVRRRNANQTDAVDANIRIERSFGRQSVDRGSADMFAGKATAAQHQRSQGWPTLEGCPVE